MAERLWPTTSARTAIHYEYDLGDDSYAIPASVVDHVDAGGMPAHAASSAVVADLPVFTPVDSLSNEGDLVARIIKEGEVNSDELADGNARQSGVERPPPTLSEVDLSFLDNPGNQVAFIRQAVDGSKDWKVGDDG